MKPFNIEKAKAGAKVITRDGSTVRIVCTDRKDASRIPRPILALIKKSKFTEYEDLYIYDETGRLLKGVDSSYDLFMAPTKHEYWVNVYTTGVCQFATEEAALISRQGNSKYL